MAGADKEKRINFKMVLAITVVITAVTVLRKYKNTTSSLNLRTVDLVNE